MSPKPQWAIDSGMTDEAWAKLVATQAAAGGSLQTQPSIVPATTPTIIPPTNVPIPIDENAAIRNDTKQRVEEKKLVQNAVIDQDKKDYQHWLDPVSMGGLGMDPTKKPKLALSEGNVPPPPNKDAIPGIGPSAPTTDQAKKEPSTLLPIPGSKPSGVIGMPSMKGMEDIENKQKKDIEAAGNLGAQKYTNEAEGEREKQDIINYGIQDVRVIQQQREADVQKAIQNVNEGNKRLQTRIDNMKEIDPDHFFNSKGDAFRVSMAIAAGLGALGSGLSGIYGHATPNYALDIINKAIDRDIDAQKSNLTNEWNKITKGMEINNNEWARATWISDQKDNLVKEKWMAVSKMIDANSAGTSNKNALVNADIMKNTAQQKINDLSHIQEERRYRVLQQQAVASAAAAAKQPGGADDFKAFQKDIADWDEKNRVGKAVGPRPRFDADWLQNHYGRGSVEPNAAPKKGSTGRNQSLILKESAAKETINMIDQELSLIDDKSIGSFDKRKNSEGNLARITDGTIRAFAGAAPSQEQIKLHKPTLPPPQGFDPTAPKDSLYGSLYPDSTRKSQLLQLRKQLEGSVEEMHKAKDAMSNESEPDHLPTNIPGDEEGSKY